jgi:hypothetical protein
LNLSSASIDIKYLLEVPKISSLQVCEISGSHGGEYEGYPDDGGSTHL